MAHFETRHGERFKPRVCKCSEHVGHIKLGNIRERIEMFLVLPHIFIVVDFWLSEVIKAPFGSGWLKNRYSGIRAEK